MSSVRIGETPPPESSEPSGLDVLEEAMCRQNMAVEHVNSLALPGETYGDIHDRLAGEFKEVEKAFSGTLFDYKTARPGDFFFVQEAGRLWPIPSSISVKENAFGFSTQAGAYLLTEKAALVSHEAHFSKTDAALFAARVVVTEGATVGQGVKLREGVLLAPNASVRPEAEIGPNSTLHPNSYVGSKAVLGANVVLEERAQVGAKAEVKKNLHAHRGGRVGRRAKVGPNVTIEEGADVFNHMRVKANTTVKNSKTPIVNTNKKQVSLGKKLLGRARVSTS